MDLTPVADRLEETGVGTKGKDVFINMIPSEAPVGVLLRNKLQGTKIDHELPGYYKAPFQVIVRCKTYLDGEALMSAVYSALTLQETQLGPMYVRRMLPLTLPVTFPISKGNLIELAADFEVVFNQ